MLGVKNGCNTKLLVVKVSYSRRRIGQLYAQADTFRHAKKKAPQIGRRFVKPEKEYQQDLGCRGAIRAEFLWPCSPDMRVETH